MFYARCLEIVPRWDKYWNRVVRKHKNSAGTAHKKVSITRTLFDVFGPAYGLSALFQLATSFIQFVSPQVVNLIIDFVEDRDAPQWRGYLYVVLICVSTFLNTLMNNHCFYIEYLVGLRVRTALTSAIYRKSVKLSNSGRKEMTGKYRVNLC